MQNNGKSLRKFPPMPFPTDFQEIEYYNNFLLEEMAYNNAELGSEHTKLLSSVTDENRRVYNKIIDAVSSNQGGIFFVYGSSGIGKTFL